MRILPRLVLAVALVQQATQAVPLPCLLGPSICPSHVCTGTHSNPADGDGVGSLARIEQPVRYLPFSIAEQSRIDGEDVATLLSNPDGPADEPTAGQGQLLWLTAGPARCYGAAGRSESVDVISKRGLFRFGATMVKMAATSISQSGALAAGGKLLSKIANRRELAGNHEATDMIVARSLQPVYEGESVQPRNPQKFSKLRNVFKAVGFGKKGGKPAPKPATKPASKPDQAPHPETHLPPHSEPHPATAPHPTDTAHSAPHPEAPKPPPDTHTPHHAGSPPPPPPPVVKGPGKFEKGMEYVSHASNLGMLATMGMGLAQAVKGSPAPVEPAAAPAARSLADDGKEEQLVRRSEKVWQVAGAATTILMLANMGKQTLDSVVGAFPKRTPRPNQIRTANETCDELLVKRHVAGREAVRREPLDDVLVKRQGKTQPTAVPPPAGNPQSKFSVMAASGTVLTGMFALSAAQEYIPPMFHETKRLMKKGAKKLGIVRTNKTYVAGPAERENIIAARDFVCQSCLLVVGNSEEGQGEEEMLLRRGIGKMASSIKGVLPHKVSKYLTMETANKGVTITMLASMAGPAVDFAVTKTRNLLGLNKPAARPQPQPQPQPQSLPPTLLQVQRRSLVASSDDTTDALWKRKFNLGAIAKKALDTTLTLGKSLLRRSQPGEAASTVVWRRAI